MGVNRISTVDPNELRDRATDALMTTRAYETRAMTLYCGQPDCGLNRGRSLCRECLALRDRCRWFHNGLRILLNIDAAEFPGPECDWPQFRDDPWRYFIRTDDETSERLYSIIEGRKAFPL